MLLTVTTLFMSQTALAVPGQFTHQGRLLDADGAALDGEVKDPFEMIGRLAKSKRVEQVFVRHVFRFYMGRNETLGDARALQDAYRTYLDSGGSFRALVVSLLSSDSFIYRAKAS